MPKINVHTPFQLMHADGTKQTFGIGVHEVEKAIADHWYVKPHTGDAPAKSETEKTADDLLAEVEAKAKAAQADLEEKTKAAEAELHAREQAVEVREKAVTERELALEKAALDAAAANGGKAKAGK